MPGKGLIPFEPWEFQQAFLNCRERFRIINKPRQCGISTTAAAEVAWEFDNVPGAQIVIISKDKDAAINFHTYVYSIIHSVRKNNPDAPALLKTNERVTTNEIGAKITSLASSKESGRSFSATHLIFDELAFIEYADDIWQAANATLSQTNGRVTCISTPKGRANLFARIMESPPDSKNPGLNKMGFKTFSYGWWDVPTYNPYYDEYMAAKRAESKQDQKKWIDKARNAKWYLENNPKYTPLAWKQEFEGAFDANAGSVFTTRQLEKVFIRNYLDPFEDERGVFDTWYSRPRQEGHFYASGIDPGRKNDPTVMVTYDYTTYPATMVEFLRIEPGRADWDLIERALKERLHYWKSDAKHDGTGVGDVLTPKLEGLSESFSFTKIGKQNMIELVQHAFDHSMLRIPKIDVLFREHQRYLWDDKDIIQDTVMANALAISVFYEIQSVFVGYKPDLNFIEGSPARV